MLAPAEVFAEYFGHRVERTKPAISRVYILLWILTHQCIDRGALTQCRLARFLQQFIIEIS